MSSYVKREYTVRFLTPAFLGDADQNGAWRTPPFKALLRQWWRVAVAKDHNYDFHSIRESEGRLFGNAWLDANADDRAADRDNGHRRSEVRLRLDKWEIGKQTAAPAIGEVVLGNNRLPASLYSGYGPVTQGPRLKAEFAIQASDSAKLALAYPSGTEIDPAIALLHRFGTLGGRSRNGWGSFELAGEIPRILPPLVEWRSALQRDWAHGLGKDDRGALLWESKPQARWEDAMRLLAQLRADMRRKVRDRLLLAYPSTRGSMPGWGNNDRVPHSLRFKVRAEGPQFVATIFHMPCRPCDELWRKLRPEKQRELPDCFADAHRFLDGNSSIKRAQV